MALQAAKNPGETVPPADAADGTIDRAHLARMTFGDQSLQRELLELFDRQAAILVARMREADPASAGALAHTLKGSALGIGAAGVAQAAEAVERAASSGERDAALARLAEAVALARGTIADMLRA
jgi:HPt (histidine-containing phosphotransfer) domain-containing protein